MTGKYPPNNTNPNQAKAVEPAQPGHWLCPQQGGERGAMGCQASEGHGSGSAGPKALPPARGEEPYTQ